MLASKQASKPDGTTRTKTYLTALTTRERSSLEDLPLEL